MTDADMKFNAVRNSSIAKITEEVGKKEQKLISEILEMIEKTTATGESIIKPDELFMVDITSILQLKELLRLVNSIPEKEDVE